MNYKVVELSFTAPLHIHGHRADYASSEQTLHSDSIYAAILQAWSILGHKEWLEEINNGSIDFACSSLFPFTTHKESVIHFLPRPHKPFDRNTIEDNFKDKAKLIKKLKWLDVSYYKEHLTLIDGTKPKERDILDEIFLSKIASQLESFIFSDIESKASISRNQKDPSNPYTFERIHFASNSGLYFMVQADEAVFNNIELALELLQYEGLGTDRNLGNGQFSFKILKDKDPLELVDLWNLETSLRTNLSLYLPSSKQELSEFIQHPKASYELIKRGGWITTEPFLNLKKQSVYMFKEGGIFNCKTEVAGNKIDLAPENSFGIPHPIWRTGKSLFLPITLSD